MRTNARSVFSDPELRERIPDLLKDAINVNNQLTDWAQAVPPGWQWVGADNFDIPANVPREKFMYGDRMDVYLDLFVASTWNFYRATRIKVLVIALECFNTMGTPYNGPLAYQKRKIIEDLQALVDDICGSIPFHLGTKTIPGYTDYPEVEFPYVKDKTNKVSNEHRRAAAASGGWALVEPFSEPLTVAIETSCTRNGQREWLLGQLSRVAELYNVVPLVAMMRQKIRQNSNALSIGNAGTPQEGSPYDFVADSSSSSGRISSRSSQQG